ncbi:rubrerythrin family protein [Natranaeroarchaeum aerophilus]|uniref:Rubrerythrin family protein n=1 Tax=Natranaeroarchaeum aerophilus TaxID=2917711 RepID=A0AAE3FNE5_9EURY|nr:rubrerythrin family protein [Natranaeroarchaeum aerophilus]MCL9812181.1 rubrerythrin family protein [Natranaeroarchaeum aerophilus]
MTDDDFDERVRDANETALSRLGSSKALYANTEGEMTETAVLTSAANRLHAASETVASWVPQESDGAATAAYDEIASEEASHYEDLLDKLGGHEPGAVPPAQQELREAEATVERLGGLVGATLVAGKLTEQRTGFFVGEADPTTASTFRGYGDVLDEREERLLDLLDEVCADDGDWQAAEDAASAAIQAAYDEYTDRLEAMGVNPKPVC